jgi:hypothetical protein
MNFLVLNEISESMARVFFFEKQILFNWFYPAKFGEERVLSVESLEAIYKACSVTLIYVGKNFPLSLFIFYNL